MKKVILPLSIALAITSCGTPRSTELTYKKIIYETQNESFAHAEQLINGVYACHKAGEASKSKASPSESDKLKPKHLLLWHMQRGIIDHLQQQYENSSLHFAEAANLVDTYRAKRFSNIAKTALLNETAKSYDGTGFEHIQVDIYRTLNQIMLAQQKQDIVSVSKTVFSNKKEGDKPINELAYELPEIESDLSAELHYERAISFARRAVLDQIKETADTAADTKMTKFRFLDDPFARMLAAATVWSLPKPTDSDLQFADAMLQEAVKGYKEQYKVFSGDKHFNYEASASNRALLKLFTRTKKAYDNELYKEKYSKKFSKYELKPGHGSVLVINNSDRITRPRVLDVRVRTGASTLAGVFSLRPSEIEDGITMTQVTIGSLQIAAKGPGSVIINAWANPNFGNTCVKAFKGLGKVMGFAMPVHKKDGEISKKSMLVINNEKHSFEVVSDLDAYARATLKDEQPRLLLKTLIRTIGKQIAADIAADAVKKKYGTGWGAIAGWATSSIATISEVADVRSWFLLPDHVEVSLIDLPAGNHDIEIQTEFGTEKIANVKILPNRIVLLPIRVFNSPVAKPK